MSNFRKMIVQNLDVELPQKRELDPLVDHAPKRAQVLSVEERRLAIANALRYFRPSIQEQIVDELSRELEEEGRIYARRFRPTYDMYARPITDYPAKTKQAAAIMQMITNNLDPAVAQFPHELITYGGNGSVFQNWAQYQLTMHYLSQMSEEQTLVLYSGHPLGLFPSHPDAPRVVITNGMVISDFGSVEQYEKMAALGTTMYGQMTAGSFMYIGPQGIVHGTAITLLNAGRLYLGLKEEQDLKGKLFVTSGLGGMSGAQAKAAVICGAIGVIAEVSPQAIEKRHAQGWVMEVESDLPMLVKRIEKARAEKEAVSIAYQGNIVDLWEFFVKENVHVDLGSDQTSLHNPWSGGYFPADLSFEESERMLSSDPETFRESVKASLRRHFSAVNTLSERGMFFWDYGNSFLVQAEAAGAEGVTKANGSFVFPSYVEDIMGPMFFDYGFGPFRWTVTSNDPKELALTDQIAESVLSELVKDAPDETRQQIQDNLLWIREAGKHEMVVGLQARILYSDAYGRIEIAKAFNKAVREGKIKHPIVLGRDHHDVSGTDSPYRETANIYDGSQFSADMAIQNVIGDAFRGATWVSIHNGGGVGWGKAINGGFGFLIDGSDDCERRLESMLFWDVNNGIARRAWARNPSASFAAKQAMKNEPLLKVTLPYALNEQLLDSLSGKD